MTHVAREHGSFVIRIVLLVHVNLQVIFEQHFSANVTRNFGIGMLFAVVRKRRNCVISVGFATFGANEFLFDVAPSVTRQVLSVFEFFATNATAMWFFIGMENYMRFERILVFKTFSTHLAEKTDGDVAFTVGC